MARAILYILFLLAPATAAAGEALQAGREAPDFSLPDLYGRTISLDYLDRHPGVILFWSTASPRSVELLEDLRTYQEQWGREDLAILAVSADPAEPGSSGLQAVRELADAREIVFPVLLDRGLATLRAYGVGELPTAVVIDAAGRVLSVVSGYPETFRKQLEGSLLLAMGRDSEIAPAAPAGGGEPQGAAAVAGTRNPASCTIPRARSCTRVFERDPSATDPAIMAVRLCICHDDAEAAQVMLTGVSAEGLLRLDLRFALAHMMLIKGRVEDARRAFVALRDRHPKEGWGEWGLGLVALAEGDAEGALAHIRTARAAGGTIPEAETAVLRFLEEYWRSNTPAPREAQFLALFEELGSVRECYLTLHTRG